MVKRWVAAFFFDAERSFRRILGYRHLWTLKAILNENQVANGEKGRLTSRRQTHPKLLLSSEHRPGGSLALASWSARTSRFIPAA
jgi:hypothetical protein